MRPGLAIGGRLVLLVVGLAAGACATPSPSPSGVPSPSSVTATASPTGPGASGTLAVSVAPSAVAPSAVAPSAVAPSAVALARDPALLDLLPPTLAGLDRQVDESVDADAFRDPSLATIATAGATALYVDPASGDFAFATLLRLPGATVPETAFRAYRDTFDVGACSQAGGVVGHAETQIAGRTTYIGSCGGGVLTYHTVLASRHVILSISSAGSKHLGEQLAAAVSG